MSEYGGMEPTGRELREPAATLVEVSDGDELCTAIKFDEVYRGHQSLTVGIQLIESFLTYPMVIGLAEMVHSDTDHAVFTFETGPVWTLTEVLRRHRDIGQACGARAAFEMAYLAAQILHEAGETGPREGCYSHGNLTPWRIAFRPDGSVQIFGYGLPPVEWLCHREDPDYVIDADSVRYAPPERLSIEAEDPSADSYALMLCVWEMMTGEPLMDGHDVAALKKSIELSDAQKKVSKAKLKGVPKKAIDLIARCLIFDPDTRLSGQELLDELAKVLDLKLPGDTLADLIKRIRGKARSTPKGRKIASMEGTGMFTPGELADMAAEEDEDGDDDEKEEKRWSKAKRRKKDDDADDDGDDKPSRRRRRRKADDDDEEEDSGSTKRRRRRRKADDDDDSSSDDKPRRRRRRKKANDDEEDDDKASAADDKDDSEGEDKPRRRRRRSSSTAKKDDPSDDKKTDDKKTDDSKDDEKPRRRRRRSSSTAKKDDEEKDDAKEEKKDDAKKDDAKKDDAKKDDSKKSSAKKDDTEEDGDGKDEKKPRRRRRSSTAKKDDKDDAKKDDDEDKKPRRRRRRSSTSAKKDDDNDDGAKKDDDGEDKPRRRRRRRSDS